MQGGDKKGTRGQTYYMSASLQTEFYKMSGFEVCNENEMIL